MSNAMKRTGICAMGLVSGILLSGAWLQAGTIYADNFPGSSANPLNNTTPATDTGGATWSAGAQFTADGAVGGSSTAGAVLPFVPTSGNIYTASVTMNTTSGGGDWLSFGFEQNGPTNDTFYDTNGAGWMLLRQNRGSDGIEIYTGLDTNEQGGVANAQNAPSGAVAMQIILNTVPSNWTVSFVSNGTTLATGTYTANPTINFVSLSRNNAAGGNFSAFQLTSTPEPASAGLLMLGSLGLLARRRYRL